MKKTSTLGSGCRGRDRRLSGFSLIEILGAVSIVVLLVMMLGGASSQILKMANQSKGSTSNVKQVRRLMLYLSRDIEAAVIRDDLGKFVDEGGENAIRFYSQVRSPEDAGVVESGRKLSLLEYKREGDEIFRFSMGIGWGNLDRLSFSSVRSLPAIPSNSKDEVCSGVASFHWAFLNSSGITEKYQAKPISRAIRISIAVVEKPMLIKLKSGENWKRLQQELDSVAKENLSYSDLHSLTLKADWEKKMDVAGFLRGYPEGFGKSISFVERFFELPVKRED